MEISRHQFAQKLGTIQKAIEECDFMAIDTELSGLYRPQKPIRLYSLKDRYEEYREATKRFIIIQFGLCTFHWDEPSGRYIAKPFNFYIFPTGPQTNRTFHTQAQAFDFLTKQSFDFNKWVYQGISYLTKEEEVHYIAQASKILNDQVPDIHVDGKEKDWLETNIEKIREFDQKKDLSEGLYISTKNAYQRRLLYQEVRKFEGLTAIGVQGAIKVVKLTVKQSTERNKEKLEKFEKDRIAAVGFRKVIDMICESKKPIVGHNMLLDVCHVIHQFIEPLPETLDEFKTLAHSVFPTMVDTKYMCSSQSELKKIFNTATALENLKTETNKAMFKNPYIDMHAEFPRYLTEMAHEAGYDAYMTGHVFLKLTAYLDKTRNPKKYEAIQQDRTEAAELKEQMKQQEEERKQSARVDADGWEISEPEEEGGCSGWDQTEEEEVYHYGSIRVDLSDPVLLSKFQNKAALVRTAYDCLDFVQPDLISSYVDGLHLSYPECEFSKEVADQLFSKYGKFIIETDTTTSSFVVFEDFNGDINNITLDRDGFKITSLSDYLKNH